MGNGVVEGRGVGSRSQTDMLEVFELEGWFIVTSHALATTEDGILR